MGRKKSENQSDSRRLPRQARSLEKVELILEASVRILEQGGLEGFTTNRVAELAGVSIGTLYQYFPNKSSVLNELAQRELGVLTSEIIAIVKTSSPTEPGARIRALIRAIVNAYGGRAGIHGELMRHVLSCGGGTPMPQLRQAIVEYLTTQGLVGTDQQKQRLDKAKAFVVTNAINGVLRAMIHDPETMEASSRQDIEDALVKMIIGFD